MEKLRLLFQEYSEEIRHRVTWPKYEELQDNTVTVLIASIILAVVIALMDLVFKYSLSFVYDLVR
jgi:preprotein translocase subunit SecE